MFTEALAFSSMAGGAVLLGWDLYVWFTAPFRMRFNLTCLDEVLKPLLDVVPVSAQPLAVQALVETTRVLPISLLLLMVGWCSWQLLPARGQQHSRDSW
jgi:hypothetical protein